MLIKGRCHCGNIAFDLDWPGEAPVATSEIDDRIYAVVNVNTFENVDPASLRQTAADFEGEDTESRLARRKRNWIADVRHAK